MAMEQELIDFIEAKYALADARNLALYNPVVFRIPYGVGNASSVMMVFSFREPDYRSYPFNVIWVPSDPTLPDFKTCLRRSGKAQTIYRDTWDQLETLAALTDEAQYYDNSSDNTFLLGELGVVEVVAATTTVAGTVFINISPVDPDQPIIVGANDARLTDARTPLAHTHPVEPYYEIAGDINGISKVVIQGVGPTPGQALIITGQDAGDSNIFYTAWRTLTQDDLVYDGPAFTHLTVIGPASVNESTVQQFQAQAHFDDASTQIVAATWTIQAGSAYGSLTSGGSLTAASVTTDQMMVIRASYTHAPSGVTHTVDHNVTVTDTTVIVTLVSIAIQGPATINESTNQTFTVLATFSDSSTALVTPQVYTSSNPLAGTLNSTNGQFTAASVSNNTATTLHAEYTFGAITQTDDHSLTVIDTTLYPASIVIQGPSAIDEETSTTFTAQVTYTNSSTANVTASWSRSNAAAGSINPSTGQYTAANVSANQSDVISVSYTEAGITVTDTHNLTVTYVPVTFDSITINGAASVNENLTSQYTVTGHFSDGSTANLTANTTWSITVGGSHASINSSGLLTANLVTANQSVTIQASTTDPGTGTNRTTTRVITVVDVPPVPIYGKGPANYSLNAAFLDSNLTTDMPNSNSGNTLSLTLGAGEYGWYAMPSSFGNAAFTDQSNGLPGGWDGATWTAQDDTNGFSSNTGPATVTYQGESWKVYRTDYPALGTINFTVTF